MECLGTPAVYFCCASTIALFRITGFGNITQVADMPRLCVDFVLASASHCQAEGFSVDAVKTFGRCIQFVFENAKKRRRGLNVV